jgi:putative ABC transport system substrate-binding protein
VRGVEAQKATSTIPIVCGALADAVHLGLIASDARPGGNVTGIEPYIVGLPTKQIELAREIAPMARCVGLLTNMHDPKGPPQVGDLRTACQSLGFSVVEADANTPNDIPGALAALACKHAPNLGSDSFLMKFAGDCGSSTENRRHADRLSNFIASTEWFGV